MSVIINDCPNNKNWTHSLRWPVVGSVQDERRRRIRYTLECGHERSQAKSRYLGRTSGCGECLFIWHWLIGIPKAGVPERALKSIRPKALRQLHDRAKARKLKPVIEITWQALERLDHMQRATLNAWIDDELQRGKIKQEKSPRESIATTSR